MTTHSAATRALAAGALPVLLFAMSCGRKQSVASTIAAEYDEAQRKGVPVGGAEGYGAAPSGASPAATDAHGAHAPIPPGAMDHSTMRHAGMAHGSGSPLPPPSPEPASATATRGQPAATLRSDAVDAPAATSVGDAARSGAIAAEMASGGHGMAHGTYTHTDAGRESVAPPPSPKPAPTIDPHAGHGAAPSPRPSPSPRNDEDLR